MAYLLSDYIVFFIFLGVLVLFAGFMIIRHLVSKRFNSSGSSGGSGLRLGLKRMFSRRRRSHSFSFKSEDRGSTADDQANGKSATSDNPASIVKSAPMNKV